jgi:protein-tyrosine-phosphatase
MSDRYTILIVCTGNTCRSPMAEGALRTLLERERPGKSVVMSAGIAAATGFPATMFAIEAARIWDCDLSHHKSQPLQPRLVEQADLILCMGPEHLAEVLRQVPSARNKAFLFKNFPDGRKHGDTVEDPIGQALEQYNQTFIEIGEYLGKFLPEIVRRIDEKVRA